MAEKTKGKFSDAEKAALKERAAELKREAKLGKDREKGEKAVRETIAALPPLDRQIGERVHAIVSEQAPQLLPKLRYGMPTYTDADGKVICFFQAASKWDTRYAALNFEHPAMLDDGDMWPTAFAIVKLTPAVEKRIVELIRRAAG